MKQKMLIFIMVLTLCCAQMGSLLVFAEEQQGEKILFQATPVTDESIIKNRILNQITDDPNLSSEYVLDSTLIDKANVEYVGATSQKIMTRSTGETIENTYLGYVAYKISPRGSGGEGGEDQDYATGSWCYAGIRYTIGSDGRYYGYVDELTGKYENNDPSWRVSKCVLSEYTADVDKGSFTPQYTASASKSNPPSAQFFSLSPSGLTGKRNIKVRLDDGTFGTGYLGCKAVYTFTRQSSYNFEVVFKRFATPSDV